MCKNEFIIPLGPELKELYGEEEMKHSLRSLRTESVRPQLRMTEIVYVFRLELGNSYSKCEVSRNVKWIRYRYY